MNFSFKSSNIVFLSLLILSSSLLATSARHNTRKVNFISHFNEDATSDNQLRLTVGRKNVFIIENIPDNVRFIKTGNKKKLIRVKNNSARIKLKPKRKGFRFYEMKLFKNKKDNEAQKVFARLASETTRNEICTAEAIPVCAEIIFPANNDLEQRVIIKDTIMPCDLDATAMNILNEGECQI